MYYPHIIGKSKICQQLIIISLFLGFCFFVPENVFALDDTSEKILELRKQIEELTKQADKYKGTISEKQKQADTLKRQIDIITSQISQLEVRINITDRQLSSTKLEIDSLESKIFDATVDLERKRKAIGELLSMSYERDKLSLLAVLLKSPRLSDFVDEAHNAESINIQMLSLLTEIKAEKESLVAYKIELDARKSDLEVLNGKQINQKAGLKGTKSTKDNLLVQTKGQEAKYQQLLSEVEKKKAEFFGELQGLEAEALKTGAFIVHVTASSVPPRGTKIFKWPYGDYYMTQGYGMTSYARRGAYGGAPHNGIDVASGLGSAIGAIGSGAILASGFNNGFGNWVAVRHDNNMVSVYAHMVSPSGLANATPVSVGSIIGYEGSTGNSTGSHLHLSLYKDFFTYINEKNRQLYFNYFDGSVSPLDYL